MRLGFLTVFCVWLCAAQTPSTVDFTRDVHPVLAARCFACHGGDKRSGGLSLRGYEEVLEGGRSGAAVVPGNSAESLLVRRLLGEGGPAMPLGMDRLSDSEITLLRAWIDQGARSAPGAPAAKGRWKPSLELAAPSVLEGAAQSPVDRFVDVYFRQHTITAAEPVTDATFARRAYLDVWGLLPRPEEVDAFVANPAPDKRSKFVHKLLSNSRYYSEHWISFWNDLLRNDEGVVYYGGRESITSWLLPALAQNLPYNQLVSRLLNPAEPDDPKGFLVGVNWRGEVSASQTPYMQAAQNSAQVFLGINLKCNSCHDSFISRWKLRDAYGLASYFTEGNLELVRCDVKTGQFAAPKFLYPELDGKEVPQSLDGRRAAVAALFTSPRNGRFPRTIVNRIWQRLMGHGIVEPADDMDAEPWSPELLDWLAADFVEHGYDLKHLIGTIMESRAYQLPAVRRKGSAPGSKQYVFLGPEVRRMTAEQFADAIGTLTGEWPVYLGQNAKMASYSRDWHLAASPLARALGRPIRDQVFTVRDSEATTLQALELVNGDTLARMLNRGARKMTGDLEPPPANFFDSGKIGLGFKPVAVDVDISDRKELRLTVADFGSQTPDRVLPVWMDARIKLGRKWIPLEKLQWKSAPKGVAWTADAIEMPRGRNKKKTFKGGLRVLASSEVIYDLASGRFTRFRAVVGLEPKCLDTEIMPAVRFFLFDRKPDPERLVKVAPGTPVEPLPQATTNQQQISRIFHFALGREPIAEERRMAEETLDSPGGLADLLWAVLMQPEFQLIY